MNVCAHEFNCRYGKGATRAYFSFLFIHLRVNEMNRMSRCEESKKKRKNIREGKMLVVVVVVLAAVHIHTHTHEANERTSTTTIDKRREGHGGVTEERKKKKRIENDESLYCPRLPLNRARRQRTRTEGRLEINIIKFARRCVTIAQSFFYSFSHHFVNFSSSHFLFYKQQQQQQEQ